MAGEVAGIDVLLYIDTSANDTPSWTLLGGQRGLQLRKATEVADARHKSSGAWPNRVPTFLDWSVSGEVVKITGDPTQAMVNAQWRARQDLHVRVLYEDGAAEEGFGVIADFSESAPHDNVATRSLDIQGNSELTEEES